MEVFNHSVLLVTLVFILQYFSVREESGHASPIVVKLVGDSANEWLCPERCAKCVVDARLHCLQVLALSLVCY